MAVIRVGRHRAKRLHGADPPALERVILPVTVQPGGAGPGGVPGITLVTKKRHQMRSSFSRPPRPEIGQIVPEAMNILAVHDVESALKYRDSQDMYDSA